MSAAQTIVLDALLQRAREASEKIMTERDDARSAAIAAIRGLEQRVQEAVSGDVLRGLKNLASPAGTLYAARVGAVGERGIDERLAWRRPALCLDQDGVLVVAEIDGETLTTRPVEDDELKVEDLARVTDAVRAALERHVAATARTTSTYARAAELAARLARAVG